MADRPVPLKETRLMDVKLHQLPAWLAVGDYSPTGIVQAILRGRRRFDNKYFYVKKGGVAGMAILCVGFSVISYIWHYKELKHERWRKYH